MSYCFTFEIQLPHLSAITFDRPAKTCHNQSAISRLTRGSFGPRAVVPLVLLVLIASACGGPTQPEFPEGASDLVGGTVFVDEGDGRPGPGDEAVTGVSVFPLVGGGLDERPVYVFDPNAEQSTSGPSGEFVIDTRSASTPALQVRLDAPLASGSPAYIDYRVPIEETLENGIAVTLPQSCASLDDPACGDALLPDLVPIIDPAELPDEVQSDLLTQPTGPPADDGSVEMAIAELFPTQTWFIDETDERRLLRFATVAANFGSGPLDIIAEDEEGDSDTTQTWQRIWTDTNHYVDRSAGQFVHHPTHDHVHFDAFERYRLLDADGAVVAEAGKVSFCLRDSVLLSLAPRGELGIFPVEDCGSRQQAINPGYGDHYNEFLDDQWIDITAVEPGSYVVEVTVDPLDLLVESDETNNTGTFAVLID